MAQRIGGEKSRKLMGFLGGDKVVTDIIFVDTPGPVDLFLITGDVLVRIIASCTTDCASVGGCTAEVGIAANPNGIIPTTDITLLQAREIWFDPAPNSEITTFQAIRDYVINNSNDIVLGLSLQADSGALRFECYWIPRSDDGLVVAA